MRLSSASDTLPTEPVLFPSDCLDSGLVCGDLSLDSSFVSTVPEDVEIVVLPMVPSVPGEVLVSPPEDLWSLVV